MTNDIARDLTAAQLGSHRLDAFIVEYDEYVKAKLEGHRRLISETHDREIALHETRKKIEDMQFGLRETIAARLHEELRAMKLEIDNEMLRLQHLDQNWDFDRVQKVLESSLREKGPVESVLRNVYMEADTIEEREKALEEAVQRHCEVVKSKEADWREMEADFKEKLSSLQFQVVEKLTEMHSAEHTFLADVADYFDCRREYLVLEKSYTEQTETLLACNTEMKKTLHEWDKKEREDMKTLVQVTKKDEDQRYRMAQQQEVKCRKEHKQVELAVGNHRTATEDKAQEYSAELDRLRVKCQRLKKHRMLAIQGLAADMSFLRQHLTIFCEFIQGSEKKSRLGMRTESLAS